MRRLILLPLCLVASPLLAAERVPAISQRAPGDAAIACPQHGPGFVQIPGTSTCMRLSGRVRSEYVTSSRRVSREDIAGLSTRGSVAVDSRTDTAYGPLRSYVRLRAGSDTGRP